MHYFMKDFAILYDFLLKGPKFSHIGKKQLTWTKALCYTLAG